jgi:hypothetical protein
VRCARPLRGLKPFAALLLIMEQVSSPEHPETWPPAATPPFRRKVRDALQSLHAGGGGDAAG